MTNLFFESLNKYLADNEEDEFIIGETSSK